MDSGDEGEDGDEVDLSGRGTPGQIGRVPPSPVIRDEARFERGLSSPVLGGR